MKYFQVKTCVHGFSSVKEFADFFNLAADDLVITQEFLYEPFIKPLDLKCHVLFQENFGSGEPSDEMIIDILNTIKDLTYKRVIAIGGGTVIDISKLLIIKRPGNLLDLYDKKEAPVKEKELIVVPTTCGTGSEVTNISVAIIKERQSKIGLVSDEIIPDHAVMIPELMKTLPYKFFVCSSIDAFIHAIESLVSPRSNVYSEFFSINAIERIIKGYIKILENGPDYRSEIMEDFALASNFAGIAFSNTGVGAVHALSFPLGGQYKVPHGEANYRCFIEVFKTYNRINPDGKIKKVNEMLANLLNVDNEKVDIYDELENLLNKLLCKKSLREYGMTEEEIYSFTESVIKSQQRLLVNTYVPLDKEDIINIYKKLY